MSKFKHWQPKLSDGHKLYTIGQRHALRAQIAELLQSDMPPVIVTNIMVNDGMPLWYAEMLVSRVRKALSRLPPTISDDKSQCLQPESPPSERIP